MDSNNDARVIYEEYQKGVDYLNRLNLYEKTEEAYRMFAGDQWHGLNSGGERLPVFNILQPIVEYKVASVASNRMAISYAPMGVPPERRQGYEAACKLLNAYALRQWELLKMDHHSWQLLEDACIGGCSCLYFFMDGDGEGLSLAVQRADAVGLHFANEQEPDVQQQPYIIIAGRRPVREVRAEARANGLDDAAADAIGADSDTQHILGEGAKFEVEGAGGGGLEEGGKCLTLLKMWKSDGVVHFCRSTRDCVYQPPQAVPGLRLYPVATLAWLRQKNSARGSGEVMPLAANQIEINKNLARRIMNAKLSAYSRLVYNGQMIKDPSQLGQVGSAVRVDGNVSKVQEAIAYLAPQSMSGDVKMLSDELMGVTKELAGAGDAALGQVNPEKASGAAIIAVRDQAALPLNKQVADYRQFVEDVAAIWFDMWAAYSPNGLEVEQLAIGGQMGAPGGVPGGMPGLPGMPGGSDNVPGGFGGGVEIIPADVLQNMKVHIRIDVSPANPITKFAQEQSLENLFLKGDLSFEEYVECLDENSTVPKGKLEEVIRKRGGFVQAQGGGGAVVAAPQ
jgi:hypothetical protein